ncbi:MAG TPA: hypothetical protein VL742_19865 [Casimicrobiaceae bacterium]|nr:hypothetical protein [Casimicrobiaceae bacterium]
MSTPIMAQAVSGEMPVRGGEAARRERGEIAGSMRFASAAC